MASEDTLRRLIFERYVGTVDGNDDLFVRLEAESEVGLIGFSPIAVNMTEAFSHASPIINVTFIDMEGDLFNNFKLNPNEEYTLTFGRGRDDELSLRVKPTKIELVNTTGGKSDQISFKVHFSHHGWFEFLAKHHNRAWSQVRLSDIVQELSEESNFEEVDISPSAFIFENIVQPHWTNLVFLNWLKKRCAQRRDAYGHYEFGTTLDDRFFFKPISKMVEDQKDAVVQGNNPVYILMGQEMEAYDRQQSKNENKQTPIYFISVQVREHYMSSVLSGAGGIRSIWYDSETGEVKDEVKKYSDSTSIQLTEWGVLQEAHEQTEIPHVGGRSSCTDSEALFNVSNVINSTQSLEITMEGAPQAHIGDLVEVIIPSLHIGDADPVNMTYSGFYLVAGVAHSISFQNNSIISKLTLTRQGYDNADLEGYISSTTGRFI